MVLDELILVLGLDTRKFTEGQRIALESFKKGKDAALDFGRNVEQNATKMGDALSMARKGALGLIGAFAGGEAAAFVGHVISMDAATGRMATSIGTSVQNLSLWQEMVRKVGGDAGSATSALSTLQDTLNQIKQHNILPPDGLAMLSNLAGFNLLDTNADEVLRKSREWAQSQIGPGKRFKNSSEAGTFLGQIPGMNQDVINLLLDPTFKSIEAGAKSIGVATKETSSAAQQLVKQFSDMTQAMERFGASMIPIIQILMKPFKDITKEDITTLGGNDMFTRDGPMDKLDRWIWGDHNMAAAKKKLADGLRAGGAGGGDYAAAISSVESGGNYNAIGPMTGRGDRAYGKYQIMGANIGPWSEETLGRRVSVQEFMSNPDIQDQIFKKKFEGYVAKYGASGASRAWLAGEGGMNDPSRHDAFGTNPFEYQRRFDKALGASGTARSRGDQSSNGNTSTSEVNIGQVTVHSQATDADGVANDMSGALKRQALLNPLNTALV